MARAMWKGAISFGLVTIPVAVYPATEEKSLKFNQLHEKDLGRVKYKRVCSVDGEEVPYDEIVKGYEYEKDRYVTLTDDDFDAVPVESSRAIDIHQSLPLSATNMPYFLSPFRIACTWGGKPLTSKLAFRRRRSPIRGCAGSRLWLAQCVAGIT